MRNIHGKQLSKVIDEMAKIDQVARKNALDNRATGQTMYNHIVYLVDYVANQRIRALLKQFGYPTPRKVGEQSMKNFWLLVQHQDFDLPLQKGCLRRCNFNPRNKAYLTDRILVNSGKEQIYGTQFHRDTEGALVPKPIKDEANVDSRRKAMGLEPFAEYAKQMREVNRE